jgi:hypothetical protein
MSISEREHINFEKEQIDAVITWIDGTDKKHRLKRLKTLKKITGSVDNVLPTGSDKTRFVDNGELKYCIASIRKFAPWIRTIHLVTDNQVPDFLSDEIMERDQINIVDHKEVFDKYEWALPTFNSRTIETVLWRIHDLAPRFIYFNDDFLITKRLKPGHFFKDGKVVLRGEWNSMSNYGPVRIQINNLMSNLVKKIFGITRSMNLLLQIRSAQLAGFEDKYYRSPHVPHPIRKETLREFFENNPKYFTENIKFRFRNLEQYNGVYLANHLEIKNKNAVLCDAKDAIMLNGEMDFNFNVNRKVRKIKDKNVRFVCIQGFERFKCRQKKMIENVLNDLYRVEEKYSSTTS